MIDSTISLDAASLLSGQDIVDYLMTNGWAVFPTRSNGVVIASLDTVDSVRIDPPVRVLVPIDEGLADYRERIADALRTIATLEERSIFAVLADVHDGHQVEIDSGVVSESNRQSAYAIFDTEYSAIEVIADSFHFEGAVSGKINYFNLLEGFMAIEVDGSSKIVSVNISRVPLGQIKELYVGQSVTVGTRSIAPDFLARAILKN